MFEDQGILDLHQMIDDHLVITLTNTLEDRRYAHDIRRLAHALDEVAGVFDVRRFDPLDGLSENLAGVIWWSHGSLIVNSRSAVKARRRRVHPTKLHLGGPRAGDRSPARAENLVAASPVPTQSNSGFGSQEKTGRCRSGLLGFAVR